MRVFFSRIFIKCAYFSRIFKNTRKIRVFYKKGLRSPPWPSTRPVRCTGPSIAKRPARRTPKPRNPRHFDTIEGGRVYQALLVTIQSVKAIYSGKTNVSDTFWRPGGVSDQISRLHFERVPGLGNPSVVVYQKLKDLWAGAPLGAPSSGAPSAASSRILKRNTNNDN